MSGVDLIKEFVPFNEQERMDKEAILKYIDMLGAGQIENFYFLSGMHIPKFCNIIAKVRKEPPIYEKYSMEQIKSLDERLFLAIMEFYRIKESKEINNKWISLCKYVLNELGNIDIRSYQVVTQLEKL